MAQGESGVNQNCISNKLPIIDERFKQDLEVNQVAMTCQLFSMFVQSLEQEKLQIASAYRNKDFQSLKDLVHNLHGSCCYCGVPRLKKVVALLDNALHNEAYDELEALLKCLDHEIALVLNYAKQTGVDLS